MQRHQCCRRGAMGGNDYPRLDQQHQAGRQNGEGGLTNSIWTDVVTMPQAALGETIAIRLRSPNLPKKARTKFCSPNGSTLNANKLHVPSTEPLTYLSCEDHPWSRRRRLPKLHSWIDSPIVSFSAILSSDPHFLLRFPIRGFPASLLREYERTADAAERVDCK